MIVVALLAGALLQHAYRLLRAEVMVHVAQKQSAGIEAVATLERANDVFPHYVPYIQKLADQEIRAGRMQLAKFWAEKATRLRPSWPYGWTRLAHIKMQNHEYDDVLETAFVAASLYGAQDPNIVQWLSRHAVLIWARLSPETRHVLRNSLDQALNNPRPDLLIFAFQHQSYAAICEGATPTAGLTKWCDVVAEKIRTCGQGNRAADARLSCNALKARLSAWTNG